MRPSRRILLTPTMNFVLLLANFSGAASAQTSSPPNQPVESTRAAAATQAELSAKWNEAVRALAEKIASSAGPSRSLSIDWGQLSTLSAVDMAFIQKALLDELRRRRFYVGKKTGVSSASAQIELVLSESVAGYVWVAKIRSGTSEATAIVGVPRIANGAAAERKASLSLQRKLIWRQPERFIDFILPDITSDGIPHMAVLEPTAVAYYNFKQAHWEQSQIIRLHPVTYISRDPRGLLSLWEGRLDLHVPGESCTGSATSSLELRCSSDLSMPSETEWPLMAGGEERGDASFEKTGNYFAGLLAIYGDVEAKLPPFFAAAVLNTQDESHWILTELDGKARLYDDSSRPKAAFLGWGDDIASVVTGCGESWQVLVSGTSDWTEPDQIQAYEIVGGQAAAVGSRLEFPGPILALWPSTDLKSVRVVSRSLQTGMYEASIVSVSCTD
jgi:hypothetical protein